MKLHLPVKLRASLIAAVIAVPALVYNAFAGENYTAPSDAFGWNNNDIEFTAKLMETAGNTYTAREDVKYVLYDGTNKPVGLIEEDGVAVELTYDAASGKYLHPTAVDSEGNPVPVTPTAYKVEGTDGTPAEIIIATKDYEKVSYLAGDTTMDADRVDIRNSLASITEAAGSAKPYAGEVTIKTDELAVSTNKTRVVLEDAEVVSDATKVADDSQLVILNGTGAADQFSTVEQGLLGIAGIPVNNVYDAALEKVELGVVSGGGSVTVIGAGSNQAAEFNSDVKMDSVELGGSLNLGDTNARVTGDVKAAEIALIGSKTGVGGDVTFDGIVVDADSVLKAGGSVSNAAHGGAGYVDVAGKVSASGNVFFDNGKADKKLGIKDGAVVIAGGDATLRNVDAVKADQITADGDLTLVSASSIEGLKETEGRTDNISAGGDLVVGDGSSIKDAEISVGGDVMVSNDAPGLSVGSLDSSSITNTDITVTPTGTSNVTITGGSTMTSSTIIGANGQINITDDSTVTVADESDATRNFIGADKENLAGILEAAGATTPLTAESLADKGLTAGSVIGNTTGSVTITDSAVDSTLVTAGGDITIADTKDTPDATQAIANVKSIIAEALANPVDGAVVVPYVETNAEFGTVVDGSIIDVRGNLGEEPAPENDLTVDSAALTNSVVLGVTGKISISDSLLGNDYIDGGSGIEIDNSVIVDTDIVNMNADIVLKDNATIISTDENKPFVMTTKGTAEFTDADEYTGGSIILESADLRNGVIKSGVTATRNADGSYTYTTTTSETDAMVDDGTGTLTSVGTKLPYGQIKATDSNLSKMDISTVAGDITSTGSIISESIITTGAGQVSIDTKSQVLGSDVSTGDGSLSVDDSTIGSVVVDGALDKSTLTATDDSSITNGSYVSGTDISITDTDGDGVAPGLAIYGTSQTTVEGDVNLNVEGRIYVDTNGKLALDGDKEGAGTRDASVTADSLVLGDIYNKQASISNAQVAVATKTMLKDGNTLTLSGINNAEGEAAGTLGDLLQMGSSDAATTLVDIKGGSIVDAGRIGVVADENADGDAVETADVTVAGNYFDKIAVTQDAKVVGKGVALINTLHVNVNQADNTVAGSKVTFEKDAYLTNAQIRGEGEKTYLGSNQNGPEVTIKGNGHVGNLRMDNEGAISFVGDGTQKSYIADIAPAINREVHGVINVVNGELVTPVLNHGNYLSLGLNGGVVTLDSVTAEQGATIASSDAVNAHVKLDLITNASQTGAPDVTPVGQSTIKTTLNRVEVPYSYTEGTPTETIATTYYYKVMSDTVAAAETTVQRWNGTALETVTVAAGDTLKSGDVITKTDKTLTYFTKADGSTVANGVATSDAAVLTPAEESYLVRITVPLVDAEGNLRYEETEQGTALVVGQTVTQNTLSYQDGVAETPGTITTMTDGIASLTVLENMDSDNTVINAYETGRYTYYAADGTVLDPATATPEELAAATKSVVADANSGYINIQGALTGQDNTLYADNNISINGITAANGADVNNNSITSGRGNITVGGRGVIGSNNSLTATQGAVTVNAIEGNNNALTAGTSIETGAIAGNKNDLDAGTTIKTAGITGDENTLDAVESIETGSIAGNKNELTAGTTIKTAGITGDENTLDAVESIETGDIEGSNNSLTAGTSIETGAIDGSNNSLTAGTSIETGAIDGSNNALTAGTSIKTDDIKGNENTLDAVESITTGAITGDVNVLTAGTSIETTGAITGKDNLLTAKDGDVTIGGLDGEGNIISSEKQDIIVTGDIIGGAAGTPNSLTAAGTVTIDGNLGGVGTDVTAYANGLGQDDVAISVGSFNAQGTDLTIASTNDATYGYASGNGSILIGSMEAVNGAVDSALVNNIVSNNSYVQIGAMNGYEAYTNITAAKDVIIGTNAASYALRAGATEQSAANQTIKGVNFLIQDSVANLTLADSTVNVTNSISGTGLTLTTTVSGVTAPVFASSAAKVTLDSLEIGGNASLTATTVTLKDLTIDGAYATLAATNLTATGKLTLKNGAVFDINRVTVSELEIENSSLNVATLKGIQELTLTNADAVISGGLTGMTGDIVLRANDEGEGSSLQTSVIDIDGALDVSGASDAVVYGNITADTSISATDGSTINGLNITTNGAIIAAGDSTISANGKLKGQSLSVDGSTVNATSVALSGALSAVNGSSVNSNVTGATNATIVDSTVGNISMNGTLTATNSTVGKVTGATSATLDNADTGSISMAGNNGDITITNGSLVQGNVTNANDVTINGSTVTGTVQTDGALNATNANIQGGLTADSVVTSATISGSSIGSGITSTGAVTITDKSTISGAVSGTVVTVTGSTTGDVTSTMGDATITDSTVGAVTSDKGNVIASGSSIGGDVTALAGKAEITGGSVSGDINAKEVDTDGVAITGSVTASGTIDMDAGSVGGNVATAGKADLDGVEITGTVQAGSVEMTGGKADDVTALSGNAAIVGGAVVGDVTAAAGTATIIGSTADTVNAKDVVLNNAVTDTVTAANSATINGGTIDGDVKADTVTMAGATITQNVIAGTSATLTGGSVGADVTVTGENGTVSISGTVVSGNVTADYVETQGADITGEITIGKGASFTGGTVTDDVVVNGGDVLADGTTFEGSVSAGDVTIKDGFAGDITAGEIATVIGSSVGNVSGATVVIESSESGNVTSTGEASIAGSTVNGNVTAETATITGTEITGTVNADTVDITGGKAGNVTATDATIGGGAVVGDVLADNKAMLDNATAGTVSAKDVELKEATTGAVTATNSATISGSSITGDVKAETATITGTEITGTVNADSVDITGGKAGNVTATDATIDGGAVVGDVLASNTVDVTNAQTGAVSGSSVSLSDATTGAVTAETLVATGTVDADGTVTADSMTVTAGTLTADSVTVAGAATVNGATVTAQTLTADSISGDNAAINAAVAAGDVTLKDSSAKDMTLTGDLVATGSSIGSVSGASSAEIAGGSTGDLSVNGDVTATNGADIASISKAEDVTLSQVVTGDITASGKVNAATGTVMGDVTSESASMSGAKANSLATGALSVTPEGFAADDSINADGVVSIEGTVSAGKSISLKGAEGSAISGADVTAGDKLTLDGTIAAENSTLTGANGVALQGTLEAGKGVVFAGGALKGTGTINKTGGDKLALAGNTDLTGGAVNVDASTLDAADGAKLGSVTLKGASMTVAGSSIGSVTADNLKADAASTLEADVDLAARKTDKIEVSGKVDLNGATVSVAPTSLSAEGTVADQTRINLFSGSVTSGANEDVTHSMDTLNAHIENKANGVDLVLSKNYKGAENKTQNQAATADALASINPDGVPADTQLADLLDALAHTRSEADAKLALDSLSGAGLAGMQKAIAEDAKEHLKTLRATMKALSADVQRRYDENGIIPGVQSSAISASVTGGTADVSGNENCGDYHRSSMGGMVAMAHALYNGWTFGSSFAFSYADAECGDVKLDGEFIYFDLALMHKAERLTQTGTIGASFINFDTERDVRVNAPGHAFSGRAEGSTSAVAINMSYEVAYDLIKTDDGHRLGSVVMAEATFAQIDGMTETGLGNAGLNSEFDDVASITLGIGARYTYEFGSKDNPGYFNFDVMAVAEAGDNAPKVNNMFIGGGQTYELVGPEAGELGLLLNAGVLLPIGEQAGIFGNVTAEFRSEQSSVGGSVGVKYSF